MIDPTAVVVQLLGSRAYSALDVDAANILPVMVVDTVTQTPLETGGQLDACAAHIEVTVAATTRTEARTTAWNAATTINNSPGTMLDAGVVCSALITLQPVPLQPTITIQDIHQWQFEATLIIRTKIG